jgi:hypothetical protein
MIIINLLYCPDVLTLRCQPSPSQEKPPLYLGFFQFVHNVRLRDKDLLRPLLELRVAQQGELTGIHIEPSAECHEDCHEYQCPVPHPKPIIRQRGTG